MVSDYFEYLAGGEIRKVAAMLDKCDGQMPSCAVMGPRTVSRLRKCSEAEAVEWLDQHGQRVHDRDGELMGWMVR